MGFHCRHIAQFCLQCGAEFVFRLVAHIAEQHLYRQLRLLRNIVHQQIGLHRLRLQLLLLRKVPPQQPKDAEGDHKIYQNMLHGVS